LKKKKNFLIENQLRAEFGAAQPAIARAACAVEPAAPWPGGLRARKPHSGSKADPITLDLTQ
jgi:hypothetical protein